MRQIIVLNPGSTSTKAGLYMDKECVFTETVEHTKEDLQGFSEIVDQLPYRIKTVKDMFNRHGVDLSKTDAFSAICTGLRPTYAGVYEVNDIMYEDGSIGPGSKHPGNLGPMMAKDFADEYNARAFIVDPSSMDEFCMEARLTGCHEVLRTSRGHPLNQRAVAMRCAKEMGKKYSEVNFVVVHMGGGISVSPHYKGKMIDTVDSTRGEGRMAPTRSGALPVADVIELCYSGKYTKKEMLAKVMKVGGWTDLLGTASGKEIEKRIEDGDKFAKLVYQATAYQIAKDVGACAAIMKGEVDAVILTGGLAHSNMFTSMISEYVSFLAPVKIYPGEFEMDAMAAGALRVLEGKEQPLYYSREPIFKGFEEELK